MGRIDRVNQQMKREISLIIRQELSDPRLQFVTITAVEVSRDLRYAKVYFSVLGDADQVKQSQESLQKARGMIRKLIAQRMIMRYIPDLEFFYDRSIEYSSQIEEALEEIKNESKKNHSNN